MPDEAICIDRMRSPQVREAIDNGCRTVLLAIGSTEQHGPHLPLGTDSLIGDKLVERVARQLGKTLTAPTIRVGASEHHMAFSGSMTLREEILEEVVIDYCRCLARHGFETIILIPTHGGNVKTVMRAAERMTRESLSARVLADSSDAIFVSAMVEVAEKYGITPGEAGGHAGHLETSLMLADYPELVDMRKAARGKVDLGYDSTEKLHELGMHALSPIGILGDATKSSAEAGEDYIKHLVDKLVGRIRNSLSENG